MSTHLIDNERLAVELPEGFESVPHKELESMIGITYDRLWGVQDTNRHILLYVTWKDSNKVLAKLANVKSYVRRVDRQFSKCRPGSGYTSEDLPKRAISGSDDGASGFRFSYTVENTEQEGEFLVFKGGERCYTLCCYTRCSVAEQNRPVIEGILNSLEVR